MCAGGHSDVLGGAVSVRSKEVFERLYSARLLAGNPLGTMESFLLLRSLRTLSVRMRQHSGSAWIICQWLDKHDLVKKVYHPCLPHHPNHKESTQLKFPTACFSFETQVCCFVESASFFLNKTRITLLFCLL